MSIQRKVKIYYSELSCNILLLFVRGTRFGAAGLFFSGAWGTAPCGWTVFFLLAGA
jgi:hypothetical protein